MHQWLGHPGKNTTFKSNEILGEMISTSPSSILPCEDCSLSKNWHQDLIKSTSSRASNPGERIYFDTSWVSCNIYGGNKYWFLLVDENSVIIWSRFEKVKSDLKDEVITVIKNIQYRHSISFICCDNEGENQALDQYLDPLIIPLTFEYTPRDTPHHNGVVERKYQTLYQRMMSMLNGEGIYGKLREKLWEECSKTSTLLNNILDNKKIHSEKYPPPQSPYQVFYGNLPKYFFGLKVFGEIGILKTTYSRLQYKLHNKGSTVIFLGYSTRHGTNIYCMFNLSTQSIIISRDITWINVKYGKWKSHVNNSNDSSKKKEQLSNDHHEHFNIYQHSNTQINHPNYEHEEIINEPNHQLEVHQNNTQDLKPSNIRIHWSGKVSGPTNSRVHHSGIVTGMTCVTSIIRQVEPNTIDQSWNHSDINERRKWRLVIKDELTTMIQKNVLSPVNVEDESAVTRPLGMHWVLKIKNNRRYRERLVSKGFLQREEIYYDLSHSPVLCDITFSLLLIYHLLNPTTMMVEVDIKKSFLESNIEEEIYIRTPDILKTLDTTFKYTRFSKLNISVYGLVQAPKNFYYEITNYLQSKNFKIYEGGTLSPK